MFTTALKDIKSVLAEFWMKEIEKKAEISVQINHVIFFLWVRSLRGEGKKNKNGSLAGNGYSVWLSCP